jgi:hypothetical protein
MISFLSTLTIITFVHKVVSFNHGMRERYHSSIHSLKRLAMKQDSELEVDVAVIGGGIAGSTISYLLQDREKLQVALIDPKVNSPGAWYVNEFSKFYSIFN